MTYDDFFPFVLPWADSCPDPTAVHHCRQAAINFFQLTCAWRETLDTMLGDGLSTQFALPIDDQVDIVKLYSVRVDGSDRPITPMGDAVALSSVRPDSQLCWTAARSTIGVSPTPRDGAAVSVYAALKPAQTSFGIGDEQFAQYAQQIANGALSTLLLLPKMPWTDPALAAVFRQKFDESIGSASFAATKGHTNRFARSSRIVNF